ncbi:MAG: gliding motility-associated C-terminal domain-containing protein, partial [Bacteroidetes bacterium]|nr:gliding motility-associated C-terminal domain-containing protein [Bacteroidota bacterium]
PVAAIHIDSVVSCAYHSMQFKDASISDTSYQPLWHWQVFLNDTQSHEFKRQNPTIKFTEPGQYLISLVYNNGFCSDSTTYKDSLHIVQAPKPGFTLDFDSKCAPASYYYTNKSTGQIVRHEARWHTGGLISTNKFFSSRVSLPGEFFIEQILEGPTGCETRDTMWFKLSPGVMQDTRPILFRTTVSGPNEVKIKWKEIVGMKSYIISRTGNGLDTFWSVENRPDNGIIDTLVFIDSSAKTNASNYVYQIKVIDSCEKISKASNLGSSLSLNVQNFNNSYTVLKWNAYEDWNFGVKEYVTQSSSDGINWLPINASNQLVYPDYRIPQLNYDSVYYRIVAIENDGYNQVSISNVVSIPIRTTLFIPNAFTPNGDGVNDIFKVGRYGIEEFKCIIYARNGQILVESNNPDNIWDGTKTGMNLPVGVYNYIIIATNNRGITEIHDGNIHLIR